MASGDYITPPSSSVPTRHNCGVRRGRLRRDARVDHAKGSEAVAALHGGWHETRGLEAMDHRIGGVRRKGYGAITLSPSEGDKDDPKLLSVLGLHRLSK